MTPLFTQLLDKAKEITGSDSKTARAIHVTPQALNNWRNNRQPITPADVALLAEVVGMEPSDWLAKATVERYQGTPKGEALARALGKALLVTGATIVSSGANAAEGVGYLIRCIERLTMTTSRHKPIVKAL